MNSFTEHKPITDFGTPTEYEQFLINRENFIEYTLSIQERLSEDYILPMMTRKDLIELASNPLDFATLKRCLNLEKLQHFDSNKKIKANSSW